MRFRAALLGASLVVLLAGCSANDVTSNVATLDAPATRACDQVRAVIAARVAGTLRRADLRTRLMAAYDAAQTSVNPVIRARAVALLTDATEIASGDEGQSLAGDLAAMQRSCTGQDG
jgi:hypothetical protein